MHQADVENPPLWPVGVFINTQQLTTFRGYINLVLMLSGIVNGHNLLCNAHAVSERHRGTAALFLFYSLSFFSSFSFYVFVTLAVLFFFYCFCS